MPEGIVSLIEQGKLKDISSEDDCETCDWCEGSTCDGDTCQLEG